MSFGFGLGFPKLSALAGGFSPASLFTAGEQGVWYDPSDLTTLFQDSAGTTPVTAIEQPVGLMLDKSKGLVLGSELVTNGTFTSTSGWTAEPGAGVTLSAASNVLTITQTGGTLYGRAYQGLSGLTIGQFYQYTAQVVSNPGSLNVNIWAHTGFTGTPAAAQYGAGTSSTGNLVVRFQATATTMYVVMWLNTTTAGSVGFSNASVKAIPGNHATQSTSTKRPLLSARVNLLTKTEDLNGAGWSTIFAGTGSAPVITSNYSTAPDGTNTASRFVGTRGASNTTADYSLSISTNATASVGASYTGAIYIKSNTGSNQNVTLYVVTGAAVQQIVAVAGTAWTRVSPAALTATATPANLVIGTRGGSYGGDQSLDILVWGADLRVTNTGVNLPVYQAVNTATDYATAGFPLYLKFDGVDDAMASNSIDFTATDKMTVWSGVRRQVDTAGMICELSVNATANAGAFWLASGTAGALTGNAFNTFSRGSVAVGSAGIGNTPSTFTPPVTAVLTGINDISGNLSQCRGNGVAGTDSTAAKGTGNFGNYPLFVGAENQTTFYFNGNLYSLIVRGAQSTAPQISATETYVNGKTKAY